MHTSAVWIQVLLSKDMHKVSEYLALLRIVIPKSQLTEHNFQVSYQQSSISFL